MGYYRKFICNYADIANPLNCLKTKSQTFIWTPDFQSSFDMLCSHLANTPIVQLPDPNKSYFLFTDAGRYCYSGILTQASTDEHNEVLVQLLSDNDSLTSVESQTQDLKINANLVHPIAYISNFPESQCRWPTIAKECFGIFMSIKNVHFTYRTLIY